MAVLWSAQGLWSAQMTLCSMTYMAGRMWSEKCVGCRAKEQMRPRRVGLRLGLLRERLCQSFHQLPRLCVAYQMITAWCSMTLPKRLDVEAQQPVEGASFKLLVYPNLVITIAC